MTTIRDRGIVIGYTDQGALPKLVYGEEVVAPLDGPVLARLRRDIDRETGFRAMHNITASAKELPYATVDYAQSGEKVTISVACQHEKCSIWDCREDDYDYTQCTC